MALPILPEVGDVRGVGSSTRPAPSSIVSFAILIALVVSGSMAGAGPLDDAVVVAQRGDRSSALESIREALPALSSDDVPRAHYLLGSLAPDWTSASEEFLLVLKSHRDSPWSSPAVLRLGEHALLEDNVVQAQLFFTDAVALATTEEDLGRALLRQAHSLLLLDRPGEARGPLKRLLELSVERPLADQAELASALASFSEGDYADALRRSLNLVDRDSQVESRAMLCAARSLLARGETTLARDYLGQLGREFADTPDGAVARALADSLDRQRSRPGDRPEPSQPEGEGVAPGPGPGAASPAPAEERPAGDEKIAGHAFYVVLGEFVSRTDAHQALAELRRRGVDRADLMREERETEHLYRIRVGPYETKSAAEADRPRLETLSSLRGRVEAQP